MSEDRTDATWRDRWEQSGLRERLDQPIDRATEITKKTLAWFPIRVWRHFLQHNGFLLAASISYQSLFAMFAVLYTAFAVVGVWLGGSRTAIQTLIDVVNSYIPNLISEGGLVSPEDVESIAQGSTGVLAVTGAVALVVAVWTAIGFVTFTRRAVRGAFGLPFDDRSFVMLKARDFLAATLFGVALLVGAGLGSVAAGAVYLVLDMFGVSMPSGSVLLISRLLSVVVGFAINAAALTLLFRFLAGTSVPWRRILPGAVLGGSAISLLQLGAGVLLVYTPTNPLLATFSVVIGFLLWFRLVGIVILVAASWIAVAATDRDIPIAELTDEQRRAKERRALVVAAEVRVREARTARRDARWWQAPRAARELRAAEDDLARLLDGTDPDRSVGARR